MPAINPRDIDFLELRNSVLCSECELISYNNTPQCLACGSTAMLSLSRVLGGSLHGEQRVRLVGEETKAVIQAQVYASAPRRPPESVPDAIQPVRAPLLPGWSGPAAISSAEAAGCSPIHSAMKVVVERGYRICRSGGIAIAANRGGRMLCEARMGTSAPALGAEVRSGISAMSARSGRTLRCDVAADDARVDVSSCRALGVNSIVASPIVNLDRVLGLVTVLSPQPYAFDDRDVALVQSLASMMAVVFTGSDFSFLAGSSTRAELPDSA
jgi:hypothetical protein